MKKTNKQYYKKIPYGSGILVHCPNCQTDGEPEYRLGGSKWVNIILLVLGIIPGILYFFWRIINCVCLCKKCGYEKLGEINGDTHLIKRLKRIQCIQNLCYWGLVIFFLLVILDIISRFIIN